MSTHRKLLTVCCAAVLAFGLAACGSSDDKTTSMMDMDMDMDTEVPVVGPTDEAIAAATAKAEGLGTAIDDAKAAATTTIMADAAPVPDPMISHSGDAVSVAIGTGATAFKKSETAPPSISRWDGSMWTRGTATEHVTLYTNIAAPEAVAFNMDNLNKIVGQLDSMVMFEFTENTVELGVFIPGLSKATSLDPAGKDGETTYPAADAETVPSLSFDGTLGGAKGTFKCEMATCSVTVNDKGVVTAFGDGDTWTFTGAPDAKLLLADDDYLHFGWWVDEMANGKYAFQSFAGGMPPYEYTSASTIDEITGTATYKGASAGLYVLKDVSGGQVTGANSGNFTASATLTASFGDRSAAGAISGSVSDFMNAYGEPMAGWGVTLNAASLDGINNDDDASRMFSSSTRATTGSGTGTGTWQGQFYGPAAATTMQPAGVAGRYDAHFPGAHIAGAFGATN